MGYTKGPWIAKEGMIYAENGDGFTLASAREDADATLISAAPDLLEAARVVLKHIRCENHCPSRYSNVCACGAEHAKLDMQAAIRKAEGKE